MDEFPPSTTIPIKKAPEELAGASPGDKIKIEAIFRVTSVSEDTVSGELHDIYVSGESVEDEEMDDEEDSEEEDDSETPPEHGTMSKGKVSGIMILAKGPKSKI